MDEWMNWKALNFGQRLKFSISIMQTVQNRFRDLVNHKIGLLLRQMLSRNELLYKTSF